MGCRCISWNSSRIRISGDQDRQLPVKIHIDTTLIYCRRVAESAPSINQSLSQTRGGLAWD